MNQFENNPQQIGLNSRQLDPYQDVYVITEDGSWSEEPKMLVGYMVVDHDVCAICRDKTAVTRLAHWGTWCPAIATFPGSDECKRIQEEERIKLNAAAETMLGDLDDIDQSTREQLERAHGATFNSLLEAAENLLPVCEASCMGFGEQVEANEAVEGVYLDKDPDPLYVVFTGDGIVEGVYRDKGFAAATVSDIGGYAIAYIGNEIVGLCESLYAVTMQAGAVQYLQEQLDDTTEVKS